MKQRILNILIALDQLAWVLLALGKGHPDETISSRAGKAALLKRQTAKGIVLTDPATIAGVQALEIAGLIAPGRAEAILTPPITI